MNPIAFFFPMNCPACGGAPFDGTPNMLCADCLRKMPFVSGEECPGCGAELHGVLAVCPDCLRAPKRPWKRAFTLCRMDGLARDLILGVKFRKTPEFARAVGSLLGRKIARLLPPGAADCVAPVPLHWTRQLMRGYNQAELLAEGVARETGLPLIRPLRRRRRTRQQTKLNREERLANLKDAFCVKNSHKCENRAILIVDDVMTTGATLAFAASALLDAGARAVYAASAARR